MKSLRVVLSVACVAMVACEPSAPPVDLSNAAIRERSSSQREAIQNGTLDTTSSNVVAILIGGGQGGICTGSLIAPNLVLTARHCVGTINQGNLDSCTAQPFGATPYAAGSFRITTSPNAAAAVFTGQAQWPTVNNTTWFTGSQVILAPTPGNTICGGDIALIRLSANINSVCPLIPRVDSQLSANEGYTAVGYGITSPNGQTAGTRYRVTGMSVFCAGNCLSGGETGMSDTYEWFGGAQTAKGTCEGDSGGPSLDSLGRVTGAVSRGDATACNSTVYSGVYGHATWIKDQTLLAATAGGFTAPAWATGGSTTVNPCGTTDAGTGGGTGTGGGSATGGGTGVGGGGGSTSQCNSGEYCAAIGQAGQSACITNANGIPPSATQCTQSTPCASGLSCWGTSASSGVCLRDCTGGVTPTGGGTGSTGGGSGTTGGGTGTGTCPTGQYCVDASGEGDFACITTSNTIPATATDCTSSGTCAAGYSCWGVSQTQAACLADCGGAATGGGGGSTPTGGGVGNVGGGVGNIGGGVGNVGGGAGNVGGGVGNVGGGVGNVGGGDGNVGGGDGQTGGGAQNSDGGLGGGSGGSGGAGGAGNGGFGGGVFAPFGGGGGGASKPSGCSCNTVDPSFLAFGLLALIRRRRS